MDYYLKMSNIVLATYHYGLEYNHVLMLLFQLL